MADHSVTHPANEHVAGPGIPFNPLPAAPNTFRTVLQRIVVTWLAQHPEVTKAELARRAEIDKSDLSKICSGDKASLDMKTAGRLAEALGTSVEVLNGADPAAVQVVRRTETVIETNGVRVVPIGLIDPSPNNPRKTFDEEALKDLAASIAIQGLMQPLVVRAKGERYEIIAGERRFRALKLNKAEDALCVVQERSEQDALALAIIENLQREDVPPLEEAEGFVRLRALDPDKWSFAEIGRAIGKSDRFVAQRCAMATNLAPETKELLAKGDITIESARILAAAPISTQKAVIADGSGWQEIEEMRPHEIREAILEKSVPIETAAFDTSLYDGTFIDEGKKRFFADVEKFDALQIDAAKAKVEALKKTWPTAALVDRKKADNFVWADNGQFVVYNKATGNFAKGNATAIVWIDNSHKLCFAEGVKPQPARPRSSPTYRSPEQYKETPERKVVRESFNRELAAAYAKHANAPLRLLLLEIIGGDSGFDISADVVKRALPGISIKAMWLSDDEKAKLWPQFAALKDAAVTKAFLEIARGIVNSGGEHSAFAWSDHEKKLPPLLQAIGETVGVKPAPEAKPAPAAKAAAAKKKHQ